MALRHRARCTTHPKRRPGAAYAATGANCITSGNAGPALALQPKESRCFFFRQFQRFPFTRVCGCRLPTGSLVIPQRDGTSARCFCRYWYTGAGFIPVDDQQHFEHAALHRAPRRVAQLPGLLAARARGTVCLERSTLSAPVHLARDLGDLIVFQYPQRPVVPTACRSALILHPGGRAFPSRTCM